MLVYHGGSVPIKELDVNTASDLLYSSKTFYNIADNGTGFCKENLQGIYKMLRDEPG